MTYNLIKQRLENNDIIILDGAIGAELEKKGAKCIKIYGAVHVLWKVQI